LVVELIEMFLLERCLSLLKEEGVKWLGPGWFSATPMYLGLAFLTPFLFAFFFFLSPFSFQPRQDPSAYENKDPSSVNPLLPSQYLGHQATLRSPSSSLPQPRQLQSSFSESNPLPAFKYNTQPSSTMSTAVNELADTLAATAISAPTNGAAADASAASASADEGRRLYIGNLAYATTEGELKDFFKAYNV
jgi:hypothetical protein